MNINPSKSPAENLVALIKDANPGLDRLTDKNVTFGSVVDDTWGVDNNARIKVTAVKNQGFSGELDVHYRRVPIAQGLMMTPMRVTYVITPVAEVLAAINAELGQTASEVIINGGNPITMPTEANPTVGISIVAKQDSLLFIPGSSRTISLMYQRRTIAVTRAMNDMNFDTLNAFGNPTEVANYVLTLTGTVGSSTPTAPALTVGKLPGTSTLKIINRATLQGAAGKGGDYNTAGQAGGIALSAQMDFTLDNADGYIFGGGGGGGGCYLTYDANSYHRSAGGGGMGRNPGAAGAGTAVGIAAGQPGSISRVASAGTTLANGLGSRSTNTRTPSAYAFGGDGGLAGQAGQTGQAVKASTGFTAFSYPGGAAGLAIARNGFTVTIEQGNNTDRIKGAVS